MSAIVTIRQPRLTFWECVRLPRREDALVTDASLKFHSLIRIYRENEWYESRKQDAMKCIFIFPQLCFL